MRPRQSLHFGTIKSASHTLPHYNLPLRPSPSSLCYRKRTLLLLLCMIGYAGNIFLQWTTSRSLSPSTSAPTTTSTENIRNDNPLLPTSDGSIATTTTTVNVPEPASPKINIDTEILLPSTQIQHTDNHNHNNNKKNTNPDSLTTSTTTTTESPTDMSSPSSTRTVPNGFNDIVQKVVAKTENSLNDKINSWLSPKVGKRKTEDVPPVGPPSSSQQQAKEEEQPIEETKFITSDSSDHPTVVTEPQKSSNEDTQTTVTTDTTKNNQNPSETVLSPPVPETSSSSSSVSTATTKDSEHLSSSATVPEISVPNSTVETNPPLLPVLPPLPVSSTGIQYILPSTEIKNCDVPNNDDVYNQRYQEVYDLSVTSPSSSVQVQFSPRWCIGTADRSLFYQSQGADLSLNSAIDRHRTVSTKGVWNGQVPDSLKFPNEDFIPLNKWRPILAPSITNLQMPVWDADRIKLLEQYQKGLFTERSFTDLPVKGDQLKTLLNEMQSLRKNQAILRKKAIGSGASCSLHVFAITNTYYTYVCEFLRSAILNGIIPHIVGFAPTTDGPTLYNWGLGKPLLWLRPAIEALITSVGPHTVVMLADAHDTIFTTTSENIIARFRYIQSKRPGMKILVTAERSCFPISEEECDRFPQPDLCSPYRNLNSGGWMGEAQDVLAVLDWVNKMYPQGLEAAIMNDQAALQYAYMNETSRRILGLALDYTNQIFMALHLSDHEVTIMKEDYTSWRHCNKVTGGCPALLHYNGGSKPLQPPHDTKLRTTKITVENEYTDRTNVTTYLDRYMIGGVNMAVRQFCCDPSWTDPGQGNKLRAGWLEC